MNGTSAPLLRRLDPDRPPSRSRPFDRDALVTAESIVEEVRIRGREALLKYRSQLDGVPVDAPLLLDRDQLQHALDTRPDDERRRLRRTAGRIRRFAELQRASVRDGDQTVDGVASGHRWLPVGQAGCYAPGGRHPLPSSVLMTAIPARVAGVERVWLACPRPDPWVLAAAAVAEVDGLLVAGGAQAVAALAFGVDGLPPSDVVAGPGNVWVTAAKYLLSLETGIDLLAGPSEVVVVADATACPESVAAELLAQAEHDDLALPILVSTSGALPGAVESALTRQLTTLPQTAAATCRNALRQGGCYVVTDLDAAVALCRRLAPEHLQTQIEDASWAAAFDHVGSRMQGAGTPVALGDYGAGPNHTLPTGRGARYRAGLSVLSFMRATTWIEVVDPKAAVPLFEDCTWLARVEGLEAHARTLERASSGGSIGGAGQSDGEEA